MSSFGDVLTEELAGWPGAASAAAVVTETGVVGASGADEAFPWASVTKLLTALTVLDAVWSGSVDLDEPAGPPGSTVRHLLSHASGLSVDTDRVLAPPGRRRIYSNRGFDVLGERLERRTGTAFGTLLHERVTEPLSMTATELAGAPAHGARGPVADLARLAGELLVPRHLPHDLVDVARTTAFPELTGVLPGFGRQEPNDWGLGFEVRGHKDPHWMSSEGSPSSFGHFGQSGAFLWVDPDARVAAVAVSDTPFGPWAAEAWPRLSTRLLTVHRAAVSGGDPAAATWEENGP